MRSNHSSDSISHWLSSTIRNCWILRITKSWTAEANIEMSFCFSNFKYPVLLVCFSWCTIMTLKHDIHDHWVCSTQKYLIKSTSNNNAWGKNLNTKPNYIQMVPFSMPTIANNTWELFNRPPCKWNDWMYLGEVTRIILFHESIPN